MTPKYKIGDIVRLFPWSDFNEHISIKRPYWTELMDKDLTISNIQDDSSYHLIINKMPASGIYYQFSRKSFSWAEEFLKHEEQCITTHTKEHLENELFEI